VRALILGVTGQDGYYLAEQLLDEGVEVHGTVRRPTAWPLGVRLHGADLLDQDSLRQALRRSRPDVVYDLAAVTAPGGAWGTPPPPLLAEVTGLGVVRLMDAMLRVCPDARLVHASSSAIYDVHRYGLYGIAKRFAHDAVVGYRCKLHSSNAVLYSHTSPRQDPRFLAPTIATRVARWPAGGRLVLTDILGRRDWGHAPDYMRALPLIAAQGRPGDYDVATGRPRTVRDFAEAALAVRGLAWDEVVEVDQGPVAPVERPADIGPLKALGWRPETRWPDMIRQMVEVTWTSPSSSPPSRAGTPCTGR
jgi:GDPmannose 4,6-dehydratase